MPIEPITPNEVREIREALGLSQSAAGELLGGGPSAFAKYESGAVKPAASLTKLLRLAQSNPGMLGLSPSPDVPTYGHAYPLEVTAGHIQRLDERGLPLLVRRLLHAEADANGLPLDGIRVAANITTPDGGEDGRIQWEGGPPRTRMLPGSFVQFQFKAGPIAPKSAGNDVVTKGGTIKDMIRAGLADGAHYVMVCGHTYNQKQIEARETAILRAISSASLEIHRDRIHFWDAAVVADWANRHPAVAIWVKELTEPGATGPFRSWSHWGDRSEHAQPWIDDERLVLLRADLVDSVAKPRGILRILGNAGIGKSRLVIEAFRELQGGSPSLSDFVIYADRHEVDPHSINDVVRDLADKSARAVIVIDSCPSDAHGTLAQMVVKSTSELSLVTIGSLEDSHEQEGTDIHIVEPAPQAVTDSIVDRGLPGLPSEDRRRLVLFACGFPRIAMGVVRAWSRATPVAHATESFFVDAYVCGRSDNKPIMTKAAMVLAAFGLVRDSSSANQLEEVADRANMSISELRHAIQALLNRRVLQRRGDFLVLQPRPVAMNLAERQWQTWGPEDWVAVLAGDGVAELKINASRQLAWLNTTEISGAVVKHVCRPGGPLDCQSVLAQPAATEVLCRLSEVDALTCAEQIGRILDAPGNLQAIAGRVRRSLVHALHRIAFSPEGFDEGARLLLRLAVDENEPQIANNATGQFADLFPMVYGETAADGASRLSLLGEVLESDDPRQRGVAIEALLSGIKTRHFSRIVGAETHGSRPALQPWHPPTREDAIRYVETCVKALARLAEADDDNGKKARGGLASHLGELVRFGLIDVVDGAVGRVLDATGEWPDAIEALGRFLKYNAETDAVQIRVREQIRRLQPSGLPARLRYVVTGLPRDYPAGDSTDYRAQHERQLSVVRGIADEALQNPESLESVLPHLTRGRQRWAPAFGEHLARKAASPEKWLARIATAVIDTPENERDFELLAGFVAGMSDVDPDIVARFKHRLATSPELAPAFPVVCWRLGIEPSDIDLAIAAIDRGILPPWRLTEWGLGNALADLHPGQVAPLFDALLGLGRDGFSVAVDLIGMYAHDAQDRLGGLRPQILKMARYAKGWPQWRPDPMACHHFESVVTWILARGREDQDACSVALTLSRILATGDIGYPRDELIRPLLPLLLSQFPEIVWPLVGQAIVNDGGGAWHLRHLMKEPPSFGGEGAAPLLLSLPPETLFAWFEAHPKVAPEFGAAALPMLTPPTDDTDDATIHPLYQRLLDEFGHCDGVLDAARGNIHSFTWSGSLKPYFERYKPAMRTLCRHPKRQVARWARRMIHNLDQDIDRARRHDEEDAAECEV